MKYELTQEQLRNLLELLSRTNLTGKEVVVFNDLMKVFANPIIEENKGDK